MGYLPFFVIICKIYEQFLSENCFTTNLFLYIFSMRKIHKWPMNFCSAQPQHKVQNTVSQNAMHPLDLFFDWPSKTGLKC